MSEPTPEQIEAAAKAMCEAEYPNIPESWEHFYDGGGQDAWRNRARAALVAAAGAAPQERDKQYVRTVLDENSIEFHHPVYGVGLFTTDADSIAETLAATVQVDEAKLADVIWAEQSSRARDGYSIHTRATAAETASAVAEWLRGGGQ